MSAASESKAVPIAIREEVDARDGFHCRVCGEFLGKERRALHHIDFGGDAVGIGGRRRHAVDNLLTVGWLGKQDCHGVLHRNKRSLLPLAQQAAVTPGVTVLQLLRWRRQQRALEGSG